MGPGTGGEAGGVLREEGDVVWSPGDWRRRTPDATGLGEAPGVGNGIRGGRLGSEPRAAPRGREGAAARREGLRGRGELDSEPRSPFGGKPPGEQEKVTRSE